jgi:hypothetical protein
MSIAGWEGFWVELLNVVAETKKESEEEAPRMEIAIESAPPIRRKRRGNIIVVTAVRNPSALVSFWLCSSDPLQPDSLIFNLC